MRIPTFLKTAVSTVQDIFERQTARFDAFKDRNPKFARAWNVLTHPTTTRILGITVSIALAPVTGGFTLPLAVSIALSCAVCFSTTLFMGLQKYRLGQAAARLKVVTDTVAAKNKVAELALKHPELDKKLQDLIKNGHPELEPLLKPKPAEPPKKSTSRLSLTLAESLYYEGIICLATMTACFGIGGVLGFVTACTSGLSGIINQTRARMRITQTLRATQADRLYEIRKEGLPDRLNVRQEQEMLLQSKALEAALLDVEAGSDLSLSVAYDAQLERQRAQTVTPAAPGFMRCLIDEINPFRRVEPVEQQTGRQSEAATPATPDAKKRPERPLKPALTPPGRSALTPSGRDPLKT